MHKPESIQENEIPNFSNFEIQMDHLILARRPELEIINKKKKRICCIGDFAIVKIKESEKINKYFDLAREQQTVEHAREGLINYSWYVCNGPKRLGRKEKLEISGRIETTQSTALLWSARTFKRVTEIWENLLSLKLQWNTTSWCWYETLARSKIIIIMIIIIIIIINTRL